MTGISDGRASEPGTNSESCEAVTSLNAAAALASIHVIEAAFREASIPSSVRSAGLRELLCLVHAFAAAGSPAAGEIADAVAHAAAVAAPCQGEEVLTWNSLAWVCSVAGRPHEEVFGVPAITASADHSSKVWRALELHGKPQSSGVSNVQAHSLVLQPFPLLWLPCWLQEHEILELLAAAEAANLWQSSPLAVATDASLPPVRTSDSAVLSPDRLGSSRAAMTVQALRLRAAGLVGLAASHCEPPQLVRYSPGQCYLPHVDWGHSGDASLFVAGQRIATVLAYLNDVPEGYCGGRTCFPHLSTREQPDGLRVVPVQGAACAWPNVSAEGMPLFETEHSAEPLEVKPGKLQQASSQKIALNLWIRDRPVPWAE